MTPRFIVLKGADRDRARSVAADLYPGLSLEDIAVALRTAPVLPGPHGRLVGVSVTRNTVRALLVEAGVPIEPRGIKRARPGAAWRQDRPGGGS